MHKYTYTDGTLVLLVLAGDQSAYEVLMQRHWNAVLSAAVSVLHNRSLAEDAAQEAFVSAWLKLDVLRDREKFGAWVHRIAVNCAKNISSQYKQWGCPSDVTADETEGVFTVTPEDLLMEKEGREELHRKIQALSARGEEIIRMFYFEDASIKDIADKLQLSAGTVKWHLNDARRRLWEAFPEEKERQSAAMIRRITSTLETLKYRRMNNSNEDFSVEFAELSENICSLSESEDKQHAMADLLLFRYWWCPQTEREKNVLMARIIEAAVRGRNEVVLIFAMEKAAAYYKGRNRTAFLEKYSLPFLKKHGFARAYAAMRIQAGLEYFRCEDAQAGFSALREAAESTASSDIYHAYALAVGQTERLLCSSYAETDPQKYNICTQSLELRMVHGNLCHWDRIGYTLGQMRGDFLRADDIFRCASCCGGYFVRQNLSVGDVYTAEDGSTLCFTADSVTVHTPAGVFHDCQMWTAQQKTQTIHTYYKEGIGIVRLERICDGEKMFVC